MSAVHCTELWGNHINTFAAGNFAKAWLTHLSQVGGERRCDATHRERRIRVNLVLGCNAEAGVAVSSSPGQVDGCLQLVVYLLVDGAAKLSAIISENEESERLRFLNWAHVDAAFFCAWSFPWRGKRKKKKKTGCVIGEMLFCMSAFTNVKPTLHSAWPQPTTLAADWGKQALVRGHSRNCTNRPLSPRLTLAHSSSVRLPNTHSTSLAI